MIQEHRSLTVYPLNDFHQACFKGIKEDYKSFFIKEQNQVIDKTAISGKAIGYGVWLFTQLVQSMHGNAEQQ